MKQGELFEPGVAPYDTYFKEVHDLQVSAVGWNDDRKSSCRPLVDALKLPPEAADVSIVQGTHDRVTQVSKDVGATKLEVNGDDVHLNVANVGKVDEATRELFRSIEQCAHGEVTRAKTLRAVPEKVDGLTKQGKELEPHVRDDFIKRGGRVAQDVQAELGASYEALSTISKDARNGARAAEDFVATLQRAIESGGSIGASGPSEASDTKPPPKKKQDRPDKPEKPDKPEAPPPVKPSKPRPPPSDDDAPPKPKPAKPKPADTGEVFNP